MLCLNLIIASITPGAYFRGGGLYTYGRSFPFQKLVPKRPVCELLHRLPLRLLVTLIVRLLVTLIVRLLVTLIVRLLVTLIVRLLVTLIVRLLVS